MRQAQLPTGEILEFPDETPDAVMDMTVKKHLGQGQQATPVENTPINGALRTVGRVGRNVVGAIGSTMDMAALVPKTIAGGIGLATGNEALQNFGADSTYWRDSALQGVDQLTNNQLQPQGTMDKVGDFVSELMVPTAFAGKGKNLLDLPGTIANIAKEKMPVPETMGAVRRMTAEQLRKTAGETYKVAESKGGILGPKAVDRFIDDIEGMAPQTDKAKRLVGENPFTRVVEVAKSYRGQPLTFDEAHEIDKALGEMITYDMGRIDENGKKILDVQTAFRSMIEDAGPDDVVGGKEGFNALRQARNIWSRSIRLGEVERIMKRAELTDNPATSIKTQFRTLLTNPNRLKGYSKAERKAIEEAATTGKLEGISKLFGSRLITVGSTLTGGGLGGVAAAYAGPAISRSLAEKMAMNKANNAADVIAGVGPQAPKEVSSIAQTFARKLPNILLEDRF